MTGFVRDTGRVPLLVTAAETCEAKTGRWQQLPMSSGNVLRLMSRDLFVHEVPGAGTGWMQWAAHTGGH